MIDNSAGKWNCVIKINRLTKQERIFFADLVNRLTNGGILMNMKEIAQLAGVTAATVSNAINGTGNVSEKKRKEIMEIIEREGYSPNRFAKSLRTRCV